MNYLKNQVTLLFLLPLLIFSIISCDNDSADLDESRADQPEELTDDELLDKVQYATFQYFWDGAEPNSGLARERYHMDGHYPQDDRDVVTAGGSGFGLMAIIVGVERGFITRDEAVDRFERIVDFLETAERYNGVWPHWMYGPTGETRPFSDMDDAADIVETAFLVQGLLTVRQYLRDGSDRANSIADRIDTLWREVNWNWHTKNGEENALYWHWSPNHDFGMDHTIHGYDETLITYILAAASPTYPIEPEVYHEGWARGGDIALEEHEAYGYSLPFSHNGAVEYSGPLFWAHYSYLGLDPRNLEDEYGNFWDNNRNHSLIHYEYAKENPYGFAGYGEDLWGLTASYSTTGYRAHKPHVDDVGVITPTAALSSFPYTPEESMKVIRNLYENYYEETFGPYGFYDALSIEENWFPERYLAIDQGPIVVMIENHRTGLLWELFMSSEEIQYGLDKLGFTY
ncbi:MAG: beta-glucosidase [Balneolaceae bacterium]|nr:beta-glucosidase [Balneolaceae bacterium]